MRTIYVAHSKRFDYENDLYVPLRTLRTASTEVILPHEGGETPLKSKDIIRDCSFVLAEISYPSEGRGIEIGWADAFGVPIIFLYKRGVKVSPSYHMVSNVFLEYTDSASLLSAMRMVR